MQEEGFLEHINAKCHFCTFLYIFLSICRSLCIIGIYEPHNIIKHAHSKILVSALEHQVLSRDTNDEIVDHQCNLKYASKHGKLTLLYM